MTVKVHEINDDPAGWTGPAHHSVDGFCHDVRNQLTVIRQYASILADGLRGPVSPAQKEYLDTIIKAVNRVADMVDQLSQRHTTPKE